MTTLGLLNPAGSPSTPLTGARLLAVGAAQPERVVTATELGAPFGRTGTWIGARTGIEHLRRLDAGEPITDLAVRAASVALARAGLEPSDVDLVLTTSCSVERADSADIAVRVAPTAASMPINAACSGFCFALSAADNFIRTGMARHVVVIGVEQMSSLIDPDDLGTSIIFGDGAGAAVLGPCGDDEPGVGPMVWGSDGSQGHLIACGDDGRLQMAGREVFRWAVETMPGVALDACARAGVTIDELAAFVPHQANARIIDAVAVKLGLTDVPTARDVTRSGNTSAASIPIALTRLLDTTPQLSGGLALLLGFGAGLAWGGQVVRLP